MRNLFLALFIQLKKPFLAVALLFLILGCSSGIKKKELKSPNDSFEQLFLDAYSQNLFKNDKVFVDYVPRYAVKKINAAYNIEKTKPSFSLQAFIDSNFTKPPLIIIDPASASQSINDYINSLWGELTVQPRSGGSLIPLRKSYVVSGSGFNEVYYGEAYFTMLGLQASGRTELVENMVLNFAQLIQDFGYIPSGNRTYYLSRTHPPFFGMMVKLLAEVKNDRKIIVQYLPQIQREYQYWMAAETEDQQRKQAEAIKTNQKAYLKTVFIDKENIINRYFDENTTPRPEAFNGDIAQTKNSNRPALKLYQNIRSGAVSGWEFSSRWLKEDNNLHSIYAADIAPIDLNALLYSTEILLAEAYTLAEKPYYADNFRALAEKRKKAVDSYFWNESDGFYHDYDFIAKQQTPVLSLASVYPLFCRMASPEQAKKVAKMLKDRFLKKGGLTTTLTISGQQWDAPYGWASLHWMAIEGLRNYGFTVLAEEIKTKWTSNVFETYIRTGRLFEKYNVYQPELSEKQVAHNLRQRGFSASNGVMLKLLTEKK